MFLCLLLPAASAAPPAWAGARHVVTQSTATDCGPAALATLLRYYLEVPAGEQEMMRLTEYRRDGGTTLAGLQKAALAKGCAADSFLMSFSTLKEQMATFPSPVVVRTLNPEPHFSVLLAVDRDYAYMADPSLGNVALPKADFLKRWYMPQNAEGFVFIVASPGQRVNTARVARTVQALRQGLDTLQHSGSWSGGWRY